VLIGDAAHATSPNMAEGASMALEDALVLTQMLATHGSLAEALARFSERRSARIRWVRQRTLLPFSGSANRVDVGRSWRPNVICVGAVMRASCASTS